MALNLTSMIARRCVGALDAGRDSIGQNFDGVAPGHQGARQMRSVGLHPPDAGRELGQNEEQSKGRVRQC